MKNSFCRICRGRFNLKYPPAAVDSENKKPTSRTIAVRIDESGEISGNICWDCEDTLLGFHKSIGEDNGDEEEPVVVDDDEILYKSLEKRRSHHRSSREVEIIQIDSSDSEHEERVTVPKEDDIVRVESASTVVGYTPVKNCGGALLDNNIIAGKKNTLNKMNGGNKLKKDIFTRGKVFESMRCPLCPYLSGIEYEVVFHIRHTHPHYTGEHLRFEQKEGDSTLTRRIIFVHLWTFFECKACGKIHDRFWPHRKHLTAHDRKYPKNAFASNNNEVFIPHEPMNKVQTPKRALESVEDIHDAKNSKTDERVLRRASKDNSSVNETSPVVNVSKLSKNVAKKQPQCHSVNKKSKSQGLLRKQQMLQARRERRRQKRVEEKVAKLKSKPLEVISKPTFKMPQQPAPRAASVVKQFLHHPRFTCKLCSQVLPSFIGWNMHMMRVHTTAEFNSSTIIDPPNNICKKCDNRFTSASNLRMHIRLSHRRKNRLVEINGNDNEEICRQTLTPKKESKEEEEEEEEEDQPDISSRLPLFNRISIALETPASTTTSALLCQYCGTLFAALAAMRTHESSHTANAEVMRIFKTKSQA